MARKDLPDREKGKINKHTLKHLVGIYRFMYPYRSHFFAGMFFLFFSSTVVLAFPFLTGKLVDAATGNASELLPNINTIALVLMCVLVIQAVFSFLRVYFFSRVSERSMADIRRSLYEKLMHLPMRFFDSQRTGELMSRITADIALLQDTFSVTLAEFFRQFCVLLIGLGILFWHTPKLTFFMLGVIPVLVISGLLFGKHIRKMSKQTQDELAKANVVVEETLQSISMVKAYTNEAYEVNRYHTSLQRVVITALRTARYRGAFVSFIILALFGGIVVVLWYGARLVASGEITIGDLTSFVIYTMFIGGSIGGLGDIYGQLQRAVGASERVREILEMEDELAHAPTTAVTPRFKGDISYKNVTFRYPTREDVLVLNNLSFHIKAGEKVALVGHSGAGKSTIVQLLLRFYEPQSGQIIVDNQPITNYNLTDYRSNIGIVPQEVILFGGTIRENIAYGKPHASQEEIIEAARKANAWNFIQSFPEGLDTVVGERGVKLSGGQRQRIAIARAILKNPAILVLDEATSSLDAESEYLVQEALETLMKDRTTLIIAHRLATIKKVDRIYVIDKGQIIEQGTHEELLNDNSGTYSNLIRLQMLEA
ncbi:MAG: ABC transporter transmembrane domain-containing protein [Cytophagales bacterium]|nr:ABC transporter transmembrane domain-containing protein [Bernardetiaceae bacterium]MDW8204796.1 ABC transporter transmembrane domain-containing protein [Cytophagales bacterium]